MWINKNKILSPNLLGIVPSSTPSIDPDAQAFLTAANITNTTQISAINTLVISLKSANIWNKFVAIYPVCGGVASSHAVNLKTPGTFNLSFTTGWTHSSTGMTPNGAAYASTQFNPSSNLIGNINNCHLSYYSRTNNSTGIECLIGVDNGSSNRFAIGLNTTTQNFYYANDSSYSGNSITNPLGLHLVNRSLSNQKNGFYNKTKSTANVNSTFLTNNIITLASMNMGGSFLYYTTKQCAFASIGLGLTDTDETNFYNEIQTYQTTLSRQV